METKTGIPGWIPFYECWFSPDDLAAVSTSNNSGPENVPGHPDYVGP
jgi:hypothetical protein